MNYFYSEFKRAIFSKNSIITILLVLVSLLTGMISSWSSIISFKGIAFFLYSFSLGIGAILPVVVPLIVVLPFSNAYLQDTEDNMIYAILTRTTIKKYYFVKLLVNSIVSALTIFIPLLLFLMLNLLLFPLDKGGYFGELSGVWSFLFQKNPLLYVGVTIINCSLFAIVYANLGFVATLFVRHKLSSLIFPFIFYTLPSFVFPLIGLDRIEPVTTFDLTANTASTMLTVYAQLFLVLGVTVMVGFFRLKKEVILDGSVDW